MISPPATPTGGLVRQQRLQPSPFLVGQVMAIKHKQDLPHPPTEIHGTRPSGIRDDVAGKAASFGGTVSDAAKDASGRVKALAR